MNPLFQDIRHNRLLWLLARDYALSSSTSSTLRQP
jgi:hypothetical protein